jgi:hypothetical protein
MLSRAITSATRAQRQLEQMRDEFQRRTSSEFSDQMRTMREEAQQLDRRQEEISQELGQQLEARQKTLSGPDANRGLADRVDRQRADTKELIDQMKDVSEQAENSEPLLSKALYDTLRKATTGNLDKSLEMTRELLRRDLLPQAQDFERRSREGIDEIRQGVEEAARSVLGDEADSLRLARQQIEELIRQLNEEMTRTGGTRRQSSEPNTSTAQTNGRPGQAQGPAPMEGARPQVSDRGGRVDPTGRGGTGPVEDDSARGGQWQDFGNSGPLTGEDFRQWSDGLRDVEEMLTEQDLRDEAARIRDRARAVRAEFRRHGTEPQWDLVREQIMTPLTELRQQVEKKLAQLQSEETMAPIDRDPVPDRFADLVRAYFESLGQEEKPGN